MFYSKSKDCWIERVETGDEVSEFDAMKAMGHSSISVTKDIYTHLRERKRKNSLADKVNSYLSGKKVE